MKILVTGAEGYIAQSVIKDLKSKHDVTGICRKDFDLTDWAATCEFLSGKYFDLIIHTAVVGGNRLEAEDDTIIKQNLDMYYNLINNKEHFGRFINFGSGAELCWPATPYGYSKRIIAESVSNRDYCLNIRIFAVFDEHELDRRFIKSNILRYISRQDMVVHNNKYMDFFYMKDLTALVAYFVESDNWLYNQVDCKYNTTHTLTEIASMINELDEHRVGVIVGDLFEKAYVGNYIGLPIPIIGLRQGIINTYTQIKQL